MSMTPSGVQLPVATDEEKQMAMIAHIGGCLVSFWAPGLIYLLKGKDSPYIRYHATQAAIYHTIALVLVIILGVVTCGVGYIALPIFWIPAIMWGLKANKGEWAGYPGLANIGMPS